MRRPLGLLMGLVLTSLVLVGCTADPEPSAKPSTSATPTPTPPPTAAPLAGPDPRACYQIDFEQAISPTVSSGRRACAREHTAQTYAVGRIDNLVAGHLLAVDSTRVQTAVARTCPERLPELVGGSPDDLRLSMLRAVWFTPTVAQSDEGAAWYRCDAVILAGDDRLGPVEGSLSGVLDRPEGRDRFGMCGTAAPGAEGFERVLCSAEHSWRAIGVVPFESGLYPGPDAARDRGQGPCEDAGRDVAADPLDYDWGYEFPDAEQWADGQTFGRCWAPD